MSGKKGMKHYPEAFKEQVREEYARGAPRKNPESQEQLVQRLQMENELLRNFLAAVGRK